MQFYSYCRWTPFGNGKDGRRIEQRTRYELLLPIFCLQVYVMIFNVNSFS